MPLEILSDATAEAEDAAAIITLLNAALYLTFGQSAVRFEGGAAAGIDTDDLTLQGGDTLMLAIHSIEGENAKIPLDNGGDSDLRL